MDFDEFFPLLVCLGNDPFAHIFVRDAVFLAQGVHLLPAFDAEFRFEGVSPVVEACMYHLEIG